MDCSKNGIKREGESCTLNNNCTYPECLKHSYTAENKKAAILWAEKILITKNYKERLDKAFINYLLYGEEINSI